MVPFPFGPVMGIVRSALPELPATLIEPDTNIPESMGVPRRCCTRGSFCALSSASLYASELFMLVAASRTTQATKAAKSAMRVRHPTGANHFQLRDHQFGGRGGSCVGVAGFRTAGGIPMAPPTLSQH